MKKIFWIEFWLWTFPPWGFWLLYKNTEMTRAAKIRLLIYSFLAPILILTAMSAYMIHHTEVMLKSMDASL